MVLSFTMNEALVTSASIMLTMGSNQIIIAQSLPIESTCPSVARFSLKERFTHASRYEPLVLSMQFMTRMDRRHSLERAMDQIECLFLV